MSQFKELNFTKQNQYTVEGTPLKMIQKLDNKRKKKTEINHRPSILDHMAFYPFPQAYRYNSR